MNAASLLFTPGRALRAPWRLLLFVVILFPSLFVAAAIEGGTTLLATRRGYQPLVSEWAVPVGLLAATWILLKWVDGTDWSYVGLDRKSATGPVLGVGLVLGLLPIAVPSVLLLVSGQLDRIEASPGSSLGAAGISFANLLPAAFGEELLLRGYIFAVLRESLGARWSLVSTSIVFGLLHMWNPGADAQSIAIVMMAGFFLGAIFLATGSLYAATAAHFVWNWFMAAALHTPVSGLAVSAPDYRVVDSGPDWLTGGNWGPEGGFGAALGMFVVLIYLYARHLRRMES